VGSLGFSFRFTDVPFSSIKKMEPLRLDASCICSLKFSQDGSEDVGIKLDDTDLDQKYLDANQASNSGRRLPFFIGSTSS